MIKNYIGERLKLEGETEMQENKGFCTLYERVGEA